MSQSVVIDCFPESATTYLHSHAIVAIDVFRATTTAVTGVSRGRACYPVPSIENAVPVAARLSNPLLVGELGGNMPYGFHLNNSPSDLDLRLDVDRPMILLSTSGTRLICSADGQGTPMYVSCLRNIRAQTAYLLAHHSAVAVIGAGARNEFREEDQVCCAWIAQGLMDAGFEPENESTSQIVKRWRGASLDEILGGKSADYLRDTDQERDIEYVVSHVDDLDEVFRFEDGQIVKVEHRKPLR